LKKKKKKKKKFLLDELGKDQTNRTNKQKNKKIGGQVEVEENQDLGMSWGVWI
jgi:hypothetical protein